ncbi:RAD55 family ATPase [Halobium palmae]|uniref:RAD55 family ATPase n=1 Tax=Halobium palmae TaxID=1776492 RepID=A0ABD5S0K2_9EURY
MRISSGVDGFDDLVDGGLPAGRLYVVCGPPGSGKTTFSSQFVTRGAASGERCLFLSMHETKDDIVEDMSNYEFGFDRAMASDRVTFLDAFSNDGKRFFGLPGDHHDKSNLTNRIVSFVESRDIKRLVVDSTMLLRYFLSDDEDTLIGFLSALKRTDATILLIAEMTDPTSYADEHYLAHGVVFLHNYLEADGMTRGVQVVKMRGTDVDTDIHPVAFDDDGIHVDVSATVTR